MKGQKGENCNLTACQQSKSAVFFNKSTQKYYCYDCAKEINWKGGRADVMRLYNVPYLCELDVSALDTLPEDSFWRELLASKTSEQLFGS